MPLPALERDEHVAEWIALAEKKAKAVAEKEGELKLAQLAPVSKGGRGKEGGVRAASRELGIDRDDARRATKVAGLSEEAKDVAREIGVDDNRTALLEAARKEDDAGYPMNPA